MKKYWDLRSIDFAPLSEAKAKLSALVRELLTGEKRIVITNQGRPAAVLMAYQDYLDLSQTGEPTPGDTARTFQFEEWKKGSREQRAVLSSIANLFDAPKLSRKGQKAYKQKVVRDFDR